MTAALEQSWPAFVLVAGLLIIGYVAADDGVFEVTGAALGRLPGGATALLGACLGLIFAVTAVLNLDTAVVFLTPVMLHAARRRGVAEEPFLYGAVFMANASSLPLPGSNLTNLIVLSREHVSGAEYATRLAPGALTAAAVTAVVLLAWHHRALSERGPSEPEPSAPAPTGLIPAGTSGPATATTDQQPPAVNLTGLVGIIATIGAVALMIALAEPAVAVLALGVVVAAIRVSQRRISVTEVVRFVNVGVLFGLLTVAVALGVLARNWSVIGGLSAGMSASATAATGALSSLIVNNLPAAALLSAHPPAHPRALLVGLNLGPNIAVTGSLSALLWWKVARLHQARPSARSYTRQGAVLGVLAMLGALSATALMAPGRL